MSGAGDDAPPDAPADAPRSIAEIMAAIGGRVADGSARAQNWVAGEPPSDGGGVAEAPPRYRGEVTGLPTKIDAEARALLAPLLREWLDAHLPEIVETAVHAELRRLTGHL